MSVYANPKFGSQKMEKIRNNLPLEQKHSKK